MDREVSSICFYYEMLHSKRYRFKRQGALKGRVNQRELLHLTIGTALEYKRPDTNKTQITNLEAWNYAVDYNARVDRRVREHGMVQD